MTQVANNTSTIALVAAAVVFGLAAFGVTVDNVSLQNVGLLALTLGLIAR